MDVRAIKTLLDISAIYTHILKEKKKKKVNNAIIQIYL